MMRKLLLLIFPVLYFASTVVAQGPGCPSVNAGADQTLACNVNCTTLNASLFQTGATTSYTVSSIAYSPPAPSTPWTNTFVNIDDVWSGVINLPFTFCYYGTAYNQLVVGANGVISFNTGYANGFCPWSFTANVPSSSLPLNSIFGAYHDMDPSDCGTIRYAISGTFPCRTFMFDFNGVCHYDCSNKQTTQRIVLYETSNTIEVYLGSKQLCSGWNGGRAVVGIQNSAGDQGLVAPGRQTGSWTATNEAWRFTPSGAPNYQIQWFSSATPGVIGTGTSVNVCPTNQFTTYSAILTYTNCNNAQVVVNDYVNVTLSGPAQPPIFNNVVCAGQTLTLSTPTVAGATYVWGGPGGFSSNAQNPVRPSATTAMSGTYTLYVVVAGCTSSVASKVITILNNSVQPNFTSNAPLCSGNTLTFNGPTFAGVSYFWSGPGGWTSNIEDPTRANATAAMSGVYSLYVVSGSCTSATATLNVVINASPSAPIISSNSPVCTPNNINLFGPTIAGATYVWNGPGGWTSNLEDPTRPNANTSMAGNYSLYVVVAGCTSATSTINVTVNGPPIPVVNIPQQVCAGTNVAFASGTYPGSTYVWTGPNSFTASTENPTITNVSAAGTGTYNLYLVQSGCTSITASSYMEVISTAAPTLGTGAVCEGSTLSFTSNTIANATYFWSGPNGFSSSLEDPTIPNATLAANGTYSMYYVLNGCTSVTSTITGVVNPTPSVNSIANVTLCHSSNSAPITITGPVAGTTYSWTNSNTAIGLGASGTNTIPSFTATNSGTVPITSTITITPTAGICTGSPVTFSITVNPTPTINPLGDQTWCNTATTTAVTPSSPTAGTTFAWTNSNPLIGLAASGNTTIPSFTATNSGASAISGTVTITPTANTCVGSPTSYLITVNPSPTVNAIASQTICKGATSTAVTPTGNVAGTTYNWTNSNSAIGLFASGNTIIPAFTGTNAGTTPISGTITVTPTANTCTGTPTTFTVTVNPTPTVNAVTTQSYCPNVLTSSIPITGPVAGSTFNWTSSNPTVGLATPGNGNIPAFTTANSGTSTISTTVTVTPTANSCPGPTMSFFINVSPNPTVNVIANQTVCNGANTASVTPSGALGGTSYSWTNNTPGIGLAASGIGTIPSFNATNSGNTPIVASITVSPSVGSCSGTSRTFTITINPTPSVNNVTPQTVCNGAQTTTIPFTGSVASTTFNWTNTNSTIGLGGSGSGDIAAFTAINSGTTAVTSTITVTPSANSCNGPTAVFGITVNPTPSVNPIANQTICNGVNTTAVNFTGSVASTTYNWTNSNPGIGIGGSGIGNIGAFAGTNTGNTPITGTFTVTPVANTCAGTSGTFNITVNPTPNVNTIQNQTVCNGASTNAVNITGNVTGANYSWANSNSSIGLGTNGIGNIPAFTAINNTAAPITANITITPSATSCTGATQTFSITVNPTPTVNPVGNQILCNGASTTTIPLSGPVNGANYAWTNSNPNIGLAATGNGDIGAFTATNNGNTALTGTVTVTPTANGCTGPDQTFTITVNPTPSVNAIPDQTLCNGASIAAITFNGNVLNTTYNWTNDNGNTGLATSGSGDIAAFAATNNTSDSITSNISVTPTVNGCTGSPQTFSITVYPTPSVNAISNQILCNGASTTAITFAGPTIGTSYTWANSDATIGLATSGSGDINVFNAVNNGNTAVTATITATPSANGCAGPTGSFTITVNPTPTVGPIGNQTICNGANTAAVNFAGTVTNTTFDWTSNNTSIGMSASGNTNIGAFAGINNGTSPVTANISVTPTANNCTGNAGAFSITVNPTPTVDNIVDQTYCNGATAPTTAITGPVAGTTFTWANNNSNIGLPASGIGTPIPTYTATNSANAAITGTVTIIPTANTCVGPTNTYTVTVNPTPSVDVVNDQSICNGAASAAVTLSGPVANTTYAWTNNNTSTGLGANGTNTVGSFTGTNGTALAISSTVTITPTANNCTGPNGSFTITVNPTPTVSAINSQTVCNGANTAAVNFAGTVASTTFNWTNNTTSIGLAASGNADITPFIGTNSGNTPVIADIIVTPSANSCTGIATSFSITVNPTPTVDNIPNQNYCNGATAPSTPITGPVAGSTFTWLNNNTAIGLAANGIGTPIPSYVATNGTNAPITGTVTITPTANACAGTPLSYTVTVNPTPSINAVGSQTLCNGTSTTGITFAGPITGTSYDWTNTNASIGLPATGNGNITAFTATNNGNTPVTATITVTPSVNGCTGTPASFTITVNPAQTGAPVTASICDGDTYTFGGQNFTTTGAHPVVFQNINGCDSTVTLNLTVNPTYDINWPQTICQGASISFGGNTYNTTGDYPVTFQTINGCDSTVTLQLTVNANPPAVIAPQPDQCFNGNSFNFGLQPPAGAGATYNWTFNGANTTSSTSATPNGISYPNAGTFTVDVQVIENTCISNGTLTVNVLAQPVAQFNALPPSGCAPLVVEFTNITTGGGNVSWTFTGGNISNANTSPVTVIYSTPGTFDVSMTVTLPNGCSDTENVPNLINVQGIPTAGFTISPQELDLGNPTATFIDGSSGASNVTYFVTDGSAVPGPDADYTFTTEGHYEVMQVVTSSGGCSDTAFGYLEVLGNTEVFIPNTFTPNDDPTNAGFRVVGVGFTEFSMTIFNRWGELLFSTQDPNEAWNGTYGGKPVPLDVYVYKVQLRDFNKKLRTYIGNVNVLR